MRDIDKSKNQRKSTGEKVEKMLRVPEFARLANCSNKQALRIAKKYMRLVKFSDRIYLIPESEVAKYLQERTVDSGKIHTLAADMARAVAI